MAVWFSGGEKKKGTAKVYLESKEKASKNPSVTEKVLYLWKQELQKNYLFLAFSS